MSSSAPTTSYDDVPYIRVAFPQTHPDRLATLASLFGLKPPPIETARVLELGCASGDNLVPMAHALPGAHFVGADLSRRQVELGADMITALNLTNVELRHANILDIDASWGRFDYIICHGIYSWVPENVREHILTVCRENMAENGVAYVSYNTYPGWHMRGLIREMMLFHANQFEGAQAKVTQARALLEFLAQSAPTNTPYGMTVKHEVDDLRKQADSYLMHEHLEEFNQPCYFHEFVRAAHQHRLQFLAEAEFRSMMVTNFPPPVQETLRRVAPDIVRMEQYMDFVRNRTFRQTLLVQAGAPVTRGIDPIVLRGWHFASFAKPASRAPSVAQGVPEQFVARDNANITTDHAIVKAALLVLAEHWPSSFPFERLVQDAVAKILAGGQAQPDEATMEGYRARLSTDLLQLYSAGLVEGRIRPLELCVTPGEKPVASEVARAQTNRPGPLTNLRHEPSALDPFSWQLLRLLDGTRDRQALVDELLVVVSNGALDVKRDNAPVTDPQELRKIVTGAVNENLVRLARMGLMTA